jgi:hypothetical protein
MLSCAPAFLHAIYDPHAVTSVLQLIPSLLKFQKVRIRRFLHCSLTEKQVQQRREFVLLCASLAQH